MHSARKVIGGNSSHNDIILVDEYNYVDSIYLQSYRNSQLIF
jgi:hypothetical protein